MVIRTYGSVRIIIIVVKHILFIFQHNLFNKMHLGSIIIIDK